MGRTITSLTSTSAGCSIANAIARAIASGGSAVLHLLPLLDTQVIEGGNWHHAGIVDENIKLPIPLTGQPDEGG